MSGFLLIASLLAGIVEGIPQVPTYLKTILMGIMGSLSAVSSSGVISSLNPATFFAALSGVIAALKSVPEIPADKLQLISDLEGALQSALTADKQAQQQVDPTTLHPIAPVG